LDEGLVCHVGFAVDSQPFVLPTAYARIGEYLYVHGSPMARWLSLLRQALPVCATVSILDGFVLARSAFRHSVNYRSVVALGHFAEVEGEEKLAALRAIIEHIMPGRWGDAIRHPSDGELQATVVLKISLHEASAKIRSGPPADLEPDLKDRARKVWAGHLPLVLSPLAPVPDPALQQDIPAPDYLIEYGKR